VSWVSEEVRSNKNERGNRAVTTGKPSSSHYNTTKGASIELQWGGCKEG